jgi:dTDP-4-amino-4,6-dideoxygalactose transaminase
VTIPYGKQWVTEEDVTAVVGALRDDLITMGPRVLEFESRLASIAGSIGAVAVSSGTAALHAAYAGLGITTGDEVVTSPLTFVATASTAALHGATVLFADVENDTGNIDPKSVAELLTDRTRVVAAVDFAGHPADLDPLMQLAKDNGSLLLEDAAHSIGSLYKGRPVGSIADITAFSFFPTKNVTTAEGGAVTALSSDVLERTRRFRSHGLVRDPDRQRYPEEGAWHQEVHEFGLNYRLPDILCALGISQLSRIELFKQRRKEIFDRYVAELADVDGIVLPTQRAEVSPMWHLFALRVLDGRRREVFDALRSRGIIVQVNYIPAYWHPVFEDLGYRRGMCPVAEEYYAQEISLPMFAALTDEQQTIIIAEVRAVLGH